MPDASGVASDPERKKIRESGVEIRQLASLLKISVMDGASSPYGWSDRYFEKRVCGII